MMYERENVRLKSRKIQPFRNGHSGPVGYLNEKHIFVCAVCIIVKAFVDKILPLP